MTIKDAQVSARSGRGIYDSHGAHRSPVAADYERLFQSGMVVLDTNVLLNLYRSNERTRRDTLAVLNKLRDRLWVPHQVLTEFWRNRESKSVRHHHSTKAKETSTALDRARRSAQDAVDRWVKDVRLKDGEEVTQRIDEGLKALGEALDGLRETVEAQAQRDALMGTAETHTDPVLTELEPLLDRRIGEPLSAADHDKAVQEAQERAAEETPPGYEDFKNKPPEQAAGDYLLWVQLLREAKDRACDVLLVTGDVKKDWWHTRDGDIPARPRSELVVELREHAGVRLYMLTPAELLTRAEELLEGLQVDEDSVNDLEQLRGADREEDAIEAGWTEESLRAFVGELGKRYQAQAKVIVAAAANGGFVDRATVYELAGYPGDRQLKGFTRPVSTVSRELEDQGVLSGEEPFLLHTIYGSMDEPSWATGFRIPAEAVPLLCEIYEGGALWPNPHRHAPEDEVDDPKETEHGGSQ
ncbi:PIN-like domain-containing protein [Streptomyces chartreusis]|uniref:PIN-like domain-containing protein n=1 Tax=Streptomyces chartreusis TaxID=1969 RepID=UPI0037164C6D